MVPSARFQSAKGAIVPYQRTVIIKPCKIFGKERGIDE